MKATIVYANGRIDQTSYDGSEVVQKTDMVTIIGKTGQPDKTLHVKRVFKAVRATNANTLRGGQLHPAAWGDPNDGVTVLVEQPDLSHWEEKPKPVEEKMVAPLPTPPATPSFGKKGKHSFDPFPADDK